MKTIEQIRETISSMFEEQDNQNHEDVKLALYHWNTHLGVHFSSHPVQADVKIINPRER